MAEDGLVKSVRNIRSAMIDAPVAGLNWAAENIAKPLIETFSPTTPKPATNLGPGGIRYNRDGSPPTITVAPNVEKQNP